MEFGLQTFTIRKAQKKDIRKALTPVIGMGIRTFEIARMEFTRKNAKILSSLVDEFGINITSIQVKPKYVFGKPERIIEFCKITGCKNVVISMLPFGSILGKESKFYGFLSKLDPLADHYSEQGITLAYHHHNWEYIKLSSGKTRMEELLSETKKIKFVHDTYWTASCGISPVRQIEQFGDRLLGVHLRDLTHKKRGIKVTAKDTSIGCGVIDFNAVLKSLCAAGCQYYVIEQKTSSPYTEIKKSFSTLEKIKDDLKGGGIL